jgi:hypothetical protein
MSELFSQALFRGKNNAEIISRKFQRGLGIITNIIPGDFIVARTSLP